MADQIHTKPGSPLSRWMSATTHLLDELAEAAGLEIDRHALIESYNDLAGGAPSLNLDQMTRAFLRYIQKENKCEWLIESGVPCQESTRCGCWLEMMDHYENAEE